MPMEKRKQLHFISNCCTAVLAILVAVLLVVSCVQIYQSGDRPFNREAVAQAAARIALPGYLCLLSVICGIVLNVSLPIVQKQVAPQNERQQLLRQQSKLASADAEQRKAITGLRHRRQLYRVVTGVLVALLMLYPLSYFLDVRHFSITNLTGDIIRAVLIALIPAAVSLLLIYICAFLEDRNIRRELEILKNITGKPQYVPAKPQCKHALLLLRCGIFAVALIFIVLGIHNGGIVAVLGKAIRICTECIGLG